MTSGGRVAILGSINMDVVLRVDRFPLPGETVIALGSARHLGGKGANQAIAAARAGARVQLIGTVGDDADGHALVAMLTQDGVDCSAVRKAGDRSTGTAHILVDGRGEHQIVVASGANGIVEVPEAVDAILLLAQLETPVDVVAGFFAARRGGAVAILNAAPYRPEALLLLATADIVIVNAVELAGYAGASTPPRTPAEAIAMADAVRWRPEGVTVVTLGGQGSITVGPDGASTCPGVAARAVDTTGAGDCFCGWLAAGMADGLGIHESVRIAHRAAAIAVTRHGPAAAMPFRAALSR